MCGDNKDTYLNHLRIAYNAFIRLLEFDYNDAFSCHTCGPNVDVVIMDGIMMGCRKDLIPLFKDNNDLVKKNIKGSTLKERVLIDDIQLCSRYFIMVLSCAD